MNSLRLPNPLGRARLCLRQSCVLERSSVHLAHHLAGSHTASNYHRFRRAELHHGIFLAPALQLPPGHALRRFLRIRRDNVSTAVADRAQNKLLVPTTAATASATIVAVMRGRFRGEDVPVLADVLGNESAATPAAVLAVIVSIWLSSSQGVITDVVHSFRQRHEDIVNGRRWRRSRGYFRRATAATSGKPTPSCGSYSSSSRHTLRVSISFSQILFFV